MQLKFLTNTRAHEEIDSHFNDISEEYVIFLFNHVSGNFSLVLQQIIIILFQSFYG